MDPGGGSGRSSPAGPVAIGLERLGELIDGASEGVQIVDRDLRYLYVNDAVCRHGRTAREALLGRRMTEVYPGIEDTEMFRKLGQCLREQIVCRMENHFSYPDGGKAWFELKMRPVDEGVMIVSQDITGRKALEVELLHSQKMDAMGRLAGGVAHDFNNLLSVILGYAQMVGSSFDDGDERRADLEEVEKAATRAAKLTRQLLAFSRQQPAEPKVLDVSAVAENTRGMLSRLIGEDVEVSWKLGTGLRRTFIDAGQLEQVLVNLMVNARDAMPDGGRIRIETCDADLDQDYADNHPGVSAGRYVMLAVTDEGIGMDQDTQDRIFDPFFTTKTPGKGTGLGLATAYGIVGQAGGTIRVYSELGHGTSFKVYLPESSSEQVHDQRPTEAPRDLHGSETILLVEDDPQVRSAAAAILKRLGYQLIEAKDAREALAQAEARERAIDLMVSDVVMPRMSGLELARRVLEVRPHLKILCFSGYTEDVVVGRGLLHEAVAFLQKPFTAGSLALSVRQVLDGDARETAA